jgi:hypothetical protein
MPLAKNISVLRPSREARHKSNCSNSISSGAKVRVDFAPFTAPFGCALGRLKFVPLQSIDSCRGSLAAFIDSNRFADSRSQAIDLAKRKIAIDRRRKSPRPHVFATAQHVNL